LGAWVDADGVWDEETGKLNKRWTGLIEWSHRATLGRDVSVKTVTVGHLYPFGHRAIKVKVTERTPHAVPNTSDPAAYLFQRTFYIPIETEKIYPPPNEPAILPQPSAGRALPFTRIRVLTRMTPSVSVGVLTGDEPTPDAVSFPRLDGKPYLFDFVGIDRSGADVSFSSPVIFVAVPNARNKAAMRVLSERYNSDQLGAPLRPSIELGGRRIALARPAVPSDTTVVAASIRFKADHATDDANIDETKQALGSRLLPAFWPAMDHVQAQIPAARLGSETSIQKLKYEPTTYLAGGFPGDTPGQELKNRGEVFAIIDPPAPIRFGPQGRGGAIVNPDFKIDGFSRTQGPVADFATIQVGTFDPLEFFAGLNAKLLGGISLGDVIAPGDLQRAPSLVHHEEGGTIDKPERLITELRWSPGLQKAGGLVPSGNATLDVHARSVTDLVQPAKSITSVTGDLQNVKLVFPASKPLLEVSFKRIRFSSIQGSKPDVRADLGGMAFPEDSPLRLVDRLRAFLGPALEAAAGQHGPTVDYDAGRIAFLRGHDGTLDITYLTRPISLRTPEGKEHSVHVLSAARPAPPKVHSIVPTFGWSRPIGIDPRAKHSVRKGGGLRIYLERPWWSSGAEERLGVLLIAEYDSTGRPYPDPEIISRLKPYTTMWGVDPVFRSGRLPDQFPNLDHVPSADAMSHTFQTAEDANERRYVASHEVHYDGKRDMWYADVEFDTGGAYAPFVRLALVRYQPFALNQLHPETHPDCHLSKAVLADFIQLAPDRFLTVTVGSKENTRKVTLRGPSYTARKQQLPAPNKKRVRSIGPIDRIVEDFGEAEVLVEVRDGSTPDRDLGWTQKGNVTQLKAIRSLEGVEWSGEVTVPAQGNPVRFVVQQYEVLQRDGLEDSSGGACGSPPPAGEQGKATRRRIVYSDIVEL
jgi:hypothetical protein